MKRPNIYVTGDTHGTNDFHKLSTEAFPVQTLLSRDDYVIICGDFGGVWNGTRKDDWVLNWHNDKRYTTLFIDGNHENFDALERFPIEEWNGGKIRRIRPNVLHLMRGQVFTFYGIKIFTFGGALSIDKMYRQAHISWWPQELPSKAEIDEAMDNLEKHDFTVDLVLTHTAPTRISKQLTEYQIEDPTTRILDEFDLRLTFKRWYFGHFHIDKDLDDNFIALYDRVLSVDPIF